MASSAPHSIEDDRAAALPPPIPKQPTPLPLIMLLQNEKVSFFLGTSYSAFSFCWRPRLRPSYPASFLANHLSAEEFDERITNINETVRNAHLHRGVLFGVVGLIAMAWTGIGIAMAVGCRDTKVVQMIGGRATTRVETVCPLDSLYMAMAIGLSIITFLAMVGVDMMVSAGRVEDSLNQLFSTWNRTDGVKGLMWSLTEKWAFRCGCYSTYQICRYVELSRCQVLSSNPT